MRAATFTNLVVYSQQLVDTECHLFRTPKSERWCYETGVGRDHLLPKVPLSADGSQVIFERFALPNA